MQLRCQSEVATEAGSLVVQVDAVTGKCEVAGSGHSRRPGTDDGDPHGGISRLGRLIQFAADPRVDGAGNGAGGQAVDAVVAGNARAVPATVDGAIREVRICVQRTSHADEVRLPGFDDPRSDLRRRDASGHSHRDVEVALVLLGVRREETA